MESNSNTLERKWDTTIRGIKVKFTSLINTSLDLFYVIYIKIDTITKRRIYGTTSKFRKNMKDTLMLFYLINYRAIT